jgi:branched-chain amino acid transport system permease protein
MIEFLQVVLNGLIIGSEYVLVAIGFTLIFGVMGVMNVAQADFYALGAFVMIWVSVNAGLGIVVGAIVGMLSGLIFGMLYYFLVLSRLGEKDFFAAFIASVGVSYFIENLLTSIVGSQGQSVPALVPYVFHNWGGLLVSDPQIVLLAATVVITVVLLLVLGKTPFGRDIRAVSESRFLAAASGVNCRAVMIGSVAVASVIATIGGVLVSATTLTVTPFSGGDVVLEMFVVAIVAGMGSVGGAALAGFGLGIIESMTVAYIGSSWEQVAGLLVLVVVLIVRPQGLFGRQVRIG